MRNPQLTAHLLIHTIAVGVTTAALASTLRPHVSFAVLVTIIFLVVSISLYPAQALMRAKTNEPAPSAWRWAGAVVSSAIAILILTWLVDGG